MKKGKIGIWMYRNDGALHAHNQLVQELVTREYEVVDNFDMRQCYCVNNKIFTEDGRDLTSLDLLFHMNFDERSEHQNDILHTFEMAGVTVINPCGPHELARDKFASNFKLRQAGVNVPASALIGNDAPYDLMKNLFNEWGSLLIKARREAGGRGIIKIDSCEQFMDIYAATKKFHPNFFLQKFIPFDDRDYRVELVAGEVLFCHSRQKSAGFKTNVHAGYAKHVPCEYDEKFITMAKAAAKAINIPLTIVDIVKSTTDGEYYVLEVNDSMGMYVEGYANSLENKLDKSFSGIDKRKIQWLVTYIIATMDAIKNPRGKPTGYFYL
jgi:ribosomal protein S6--L-glutamate ligase